MRSCFAQPSTLRKPLLIAERDAAKKTILVTGATGYIGSRVVERLLARGHDVHVLCRPRVHATPGDMLRYLQLLPGAQKHLTVVSGDVTDGAALQAAMAQCDQLVHLAAIVDVLPPKNEQHKRQMLETALQGTRMVLDAATAAGSISKVILASSVVAVMWDWWERGAEHVYTEADWTLDSSVALNCYAYCKRESERLAYAMAAGKSWELATINPGIVFGPVASTKLAKSASVWIPIVEHMNGAKFPFTSNMYISHVDLDDVAAAICGLLATPGATGRHLLMSGPPPSMPQIAATLAQAYPTARVPFLTAPGFIVALLAKFNTHKLGFDLHKFRAMHNKPYKVDASKIRQVLPDFTYTPLQDSIKAAADSIVALGLASFPDTASRCGCLSWVRSACHSAGLLGSIWRYAAASAQASALAAVAEATNDSSAAAAAAEPQSHEEQELESADSAGSSGAVAFVISPSVSSIKLVEKSVSSSTVPSIQPAGVASSLALGLESAQTTA